jgi:hypothetical protein
MGVMASRQYHKRVQASTHPLLRHGLGPLLLRPVAMVQGSLITQQPSSLAPCWTVQFYQDSADVPLHSLPVAETSAMW